MTHLEYDLSRFSLSDMTRCGAVLRKQGVGATSMEEAADRVVRELHQSLRMPDRTQPACALVRLFVTLPYDELEPELRGAAGAALAGIEAQPGMKCLTLLGTAGHEPQWNSRRTSVGHRSLPLPSEAAIAKSPMIAQLIRQLGIQAAALVAPDRTFMVDQAQHSFNVFHVPEAKGSPYIPAQREFVIPYGVQSVLGFGGLFPTGELFATILFAKCPVPRETAELFRTLALNVKVALLPFVSGRIFA